MHKTRDYSYALNSCKFQQLAFLINYSNNSLQKAQFLHIDDQNKVIQ